MRIIPKDMGENLRLAVNTFCYPAMQANHPDSHGSNREIWRHFLVTMSKHNRSCARYTLGHEFEDFSDCYWTLATSSHQKGAGNAELDRLQESENSLDSSCIIAFGVWWRTSSIPSIENQLPLLYGNVKLFGLLHLSRSSLSSVNSILL